MRTQKRPPSSSGHTADIPWELLPRAEFLLARYTSSSVFSIKLTRGKGQDGKCVAGVGREADWSTGKDSWVVMTFDPSDTPEQKAALQDILGQLYPFKWERAATDTVAFSWNVDEKTGEAHALMSNGKGEVVLERVTGTDPRQEIVIPNLQYWMAQSNNGFRMWKTKDERYSGQGQDFDYKGTNGFLITITFSGKATANPAD